MVPLSIAAIVTLALLRLAWVDMRRFEVDPAAALVAAGGLIALRYTLQADLLFAIARAAAVALFVGIRAFTRPGSIGLGDMAIIPLIALAAPRSHLIVVFVLYGLLTLGLSLLYLKARGKPLSRLRRSAAPAAPAAAVASLVAMALLASPTLVALALSLVFSTAAILTLFTLVGSSLHVR